MFFVSYFHSRPGHGHQVPPEVPLRGSVAQSRHGAGGGVNLSQFTPQPHPPRPKLRPVSQPVPVGPLPPGTAPAAPPGPPGPPKVAPQPPYPPLPIPAGFPPGQWMPCFLYMPLMPPPGPPPAVSKLTQVKTELSGSEMEAIDSKHLLYNNFGCVTVTNVETLIYIIIPDPIFQWPRQEIEVEKEPPVSEKSGKPAGNKDKADKEKADKEKAAKEKADEDKEKRKEREKEKAAREKAKKEKAEKAKSIDAKRGDLFS